MDTNTITSVRSFYPQSIYHKYNKKKILQFNIKKHDNGNIHFKTVQM